MNADKTGGDKKNNNKKKKSLKILEMMQHTLLPSRREREGKGLPSSTKGKGLGLQLCRIAKLCKTLL